MTKVRRLGNKILYLTAAIAWTACSNDLVREDTLPDKGCILTIEATKGGTDTRGLNPDGNTINTFWSEGDLVTVLSANNSVIGTMTPVNIDGNKAKLEAKLTSPVKKGDQLTLVFPRTGRDYTGQKGTLADIAAKYDYATASVTVQYADDSFVSATDAHFLNQQAIVRFNLKDGNNQPINASNLTIAGDGLIQKESTTGSLIIAPTAATNEIYAALSGLNGKVTLTATKGSSTYSYTTPDAKTLTNGGFYRVTATLTKEPTPYPQPLTLESIDDNCKVIVTHCVNLQYKKNNSEWYDYSSGSEIKLTNKGEWVSFRGTESTKGDGSSYDMNIQCIGNFFVYGNVMSLLDKDNFATMTVLPYPRTFRNLFNGNKNITHKEGKDLVLPATTLKSSSYYQMFSGCTNLNYVKCLATDISANNCTYNWLYEVARKGTFVQAEGVNWPTDSYSGIPYGWTPHTE
jgi:hypothetical protein